MDGMPAYVGKLFEEVMAYSPVAGTDNFQHQFPISRKNWLLGVMGIVALFIAPLVIRG